MLKTKTFWFFTVIYLIISIDIIYSSSSWKTEELKCKLIAENYCVVKNEKDTLQVIDILHVDDTKKIVGKDVVYDTYKASLFGRLLLVFTLYLFLVVVIHLSRHERSGPSLPDFSIDF